MKTEINRFGTFFAKEARFDGPSMILADGQENYRDALNNVVFVIKDNGRIYVIGNSGFSVAATIRELL